MPKTASYLLIWSPERDRYELCKPNDGKYCLPLNGEDNWDSWLTNHTSFSFQGRYGRLTLLKEPRRHGDGYWYAYRRQGKHVAKKYLGQTRKLSLTQLEEAARLLNVQQSSPEDSTRPEHIPALEPKLRLPRQRSSMVRREALFTRLTSGLEYKMTLISAPAGFGKTTLVSAWAAEYNAQRGMPVVAWLSLDEGDNDPLRFWHYIIAACTCTFLSADQKSALSNNQTRQRQSDQAIELALAELLNQLASLNEQFVLVLEDYHLISSPSIHAFLARLIDRLPPTLHIIMLTRHDPPFSLARWRAYGDLLELQANDLRFSPEETRSFLELALPVALSNKALEQLIARTEGWAVGIQLAGLALYGLNNIQAIEQTLATITGSRRSIVDYLVEEVLHTQDERLQHFLLSTSILHRLTPSLCDAVTGKTDSESLLQQLEQANLFLVALEGNQSWYRYHALFAEAMRHEAQKVFGEEQMRALYAQACCWYEKHGFLNEAIESAFA
ncbi:MAG TPA: AAA family ATPase, partial [Ktedonobacteraceae bacterium]|nr:AAA family ATPase [Ktedonobacteraceae bacterium]